MPDLSVNTNTSIEAVAGVIGKHGFRLLAGLEGGYVAELLAPRVRVPVHKVEMLKLADEDSSHRHAAHSAALSRLQRRVSPVKASPSGTTLRGLDSLTPSLSVVIRPAEGVLWMPSAIPRTQYLTAILRSDALCSGWPTIVYLVHQFQSNKEDATTPV